MKQLNNFTIIALFKKKEEEMYKKRPIALILIAVCTIVLVMLPLISECSAKTKKTWNLNLWLSFPETPQLAFVHDFTKNIADQSDGRIVITPFFAESLCPANEAIDGVRSGMVSMGIFQTMTNPGEFPVSDIGALPFNFSSTSKLVAALNKLYADGLMPEYVDQGFKPFAFLGVGLQGFYFVDKKVEKLEDFKGLKIRSQNKVTTDIITLLGGAPVTMATSEVYMAADRGVIDGYMSSPGAVALFKNYEVTKYCLDHTVCVGNMFGAVNQKIWDSLPSDLQDVLENNLVQLAKQIQDWVNWFDTDFGKKVLVEKGIDVYTLAPDEFARWKEATQPVRDKFIKKLDDAGLQGQKIYSIAEEAAAAH